jgi:hypothetical protein
MDTWHSEELIKEFYASLLTEGMPGPAAAGHRDKLRFFLHAYLAEEWPRPLDRIDSSIIRDFLGSWFIRQVGGSKADLANYLKTFRRFSEHLYNNARFSEIEYRDIKTACSNRDYFMARYDEYFHPVPDVRERLAGGTPAKDYGLRLGPHFESRIDRRLWMLVHNLEKAQTPAVLDLTLFLDYAATERIKLTGTHARLPGRHVARINERFSRPEPLPGKAAMRRSLRITWFFYLALELKLVKITKNKALRMEPEAEAFLDLDPDTRLTLILDATWNGIRWAGLGSAEAGRVSEWAQENRDGFAALLADLAPNREWILDPDPEIDRRDALLARYIMFHEVVESAVMFALRETGVLDYDSWESESLKSLQVKSITMTRFGRRVMKHLARDASRRDPLLTGALERLQECLLFY